MSKENEKTLTLEERFAHLERIVARMEDADVSLDEAFELYKKGLDEVKSANDMVPVSYTHLTLPTTSRV